LTEFVTLEINEEDLVEVEPKAVLVAPLEINDEIDEDETDTDTDETELQAD
jgi:hypothetical protein